MLPPPPPPPPPAPGRTPPGRPPPRPRRGSRPPKPRGSPPLSSPPPPGAPPPPPPPPPRPGGAPRRGPSVAQPQQRIPRHEAERLALVLLHLAAAPPPARLVSRTADRLQVVRDRWQDETSLPEGRRHREAVRRHEPPRVRSAPPHAAHEAAARPRHDDGAPAPDEPHDLRELGRREIERRVEHHEHGRAVPGVPLQIEQRRAASLDGDPQAGEHLVRRAAPPGAAEKRRRTEIEVGRPAAAPVARPHRHPHGERQQQDEPDLKPPQHARTPAPLRPRTRGTPARRTGRRRRGGGTSARPDRRATRDPRGRGALRRRTLRASWMDGT